MKASDLIELRHLRFFVAAAEHGSFRKGGMAMGVQESSVSRRIRDLEDRLGASLFCRHSFGVTLTHAGEHFLHRVRGILQQVETSVSEVGMAGNATCGRVRIGVPCSIASGFLTKLLQTYSNRHPGVQFELVEGTPAELVASVRQLGLDIAFLAECQTCAGCETEQLWSERIFIALPEQHDLARKQEVVWADLAHETLLVSGDVHGSGPHDHLIQNLAKLGLHAKFEMHQLERCNLIALTSLGRGLALVCEATTAMQYPGIAYLPVKLGTLPFSAVWSAVNDNPALRRLLSMARAQVQKLGKSPDSL